MLEEWKENLKFKDSTWNTKKVLCVRCKELATEKHHVTYIPKVIRKLCNNCHKIITRMNTAYVAPQNSKLSNDQRLLVWRRFMGLENC